MIFSPIVTSNNGQIQNIGGMIVEFSLFPPVPNANEKVSFIVSFINSTDHTFLDQNISLSVIVYSIQGQKVLEIPNLIVEGGLYQFNWTGFPKDGVYQPTIIFNLENSNTSYSTHYFFGVKSSIQGFTFEELIVFIGLFFAAGFFTHLIFSRNKKRRK